MSEPLSSSLRRGKCARCHLAFRWKPPPRLADAFCPQCGNKLEATTYLLRWPWRERQAVGAQRAHRLRLKRGPAG